MPPADQKKWLITFYSWIKISVSSNDNLKNLLLWQRLSKGKLQVSVQVKLSMTAILFTKICILFQAFSSITLREGFEILAVVHKICLSAINLVICLWLRELSGTCKRMHLSRYANKCASRTGPMHWLTQKNCNMPVTLQYRVIKFTIKVTNGNASGALNAGL